MRRKLRRHAAVYFGSLSWLIATSAPSDAQTWRWSYVTRTPNTPPLAAQSTVTVAAGQLRMTYTVPLQRRQVVIESCRATLSDVRSAGTVHSDGRTYLLVQLKSPSGAACASGRRGAVALPADDGRDVSVVAAAINRSCCSAPPIIAALTPRPSPSGSPHLKVASHAAPLPAGALPSPSTAPATTPLPAATRLPVATRTPVGLHPILDWVESDGLFSFVRVGNTSAGAVVIRGIEIFACTDVGLGCGTTARELSVDTRGVATIATVAASDASSLPAFKYRYRVLHGRATSVQAGSSQTKPPRGFARMSGQEIRTAEAGALIVAHVTAAPVKESIVSAKLLQRGSSRLAIGQTGTALVRITIAENGTPQEATIVSITNRRLAAAAIETAVSSTYAPALRNGRAIVAKYVATFSFNGDDPATAAIPVWKRSPAGAIPSPSAVATLSPAAPTATPSSSALPQTATSPVPPPTTAPVAPPTTDPVPLATTAPIPTPTTAPIPTPTATLIPSPTAAPIPTPTGTLIRSPTAAPIPTPTGTLIPSQTTAPIATPTAAPIPTPIPVPNPLPTASPHQP